MGLVGLNLSKTVPAGAKKPAKVGAVPANFDGRDKWGTCIHPIRDQLHCGSCWAFAASEMITDRFCIDSNKKVDVVLSPQDMVSCDDWNMGCSGGNLIFAMNYLEETGIVSDACLPYTSGEGDDGTCPTDNKCTATGQTWKKYKCEDYSTVYADTPEDIQNEIYANGPMETGFQVYEDFMNYKSGIY